MGPRGAWGAAAPGQEVLVPASCFEPVGWAGSPAHVFQLPFVEAALPRLPRHFDIIAAVLLPASPTIASTPAKTQPTNSLTPTRGKTKQTK